jgi:hypothetical protein
MNDQLPEERWGSAYLKALFLKVEAEKLLSLSEAAELLPNRPHVSTLWRWCRRGVKGVRLRTLIVGGRRYTTPSFLEDFVVHLSEPRVVTPTTGSQERAQQKARAEEIAAAMF